MEYSTDERCIGTWIDGKPLYRKVISTTTNWSAVNQTIPHGISNLGHAINLTVFLGSYLLPYFSNGAAMTYISTVNKNAIAVINSGTWLEYRLVAIIEYTKAES